MASKVVCICVFVCVYEQYVCIALFCMHSCLCSEDWYCACRAGYIGKYCETPMCATSPCMYGSTCVQDSTQPQGYRCVCSHGRHGHHCQQGMTPQYVVLGSWGQHSQVVNWRMNWWVLIYAPSIWRFQDNCFQTCCQSKCPYTSSVVNHAIHAIGWNIVFGDNAMYCKEVAIREHLWSVFPPVLAHCQSSSPFQYGPVPLWLNRP